MAREPMKIKTYSTNAIYVPVTLNFVNLRHLESDFRLAVADPAKYLGGNDPDQKSLPVPESERVVLERALRRFRESGWQEAMIREALQGMTEVPLPADYAERILRNNAAAMQGLQGYFAGNPDALLQAAMDVVEHRAAAGDANSLNMTALNSPLVVQKATALGLRGITYVESFPMLLASPGYHRLPDEVNSKFNTFTTPGSDKRNIYVEPYETEALIFDLDAARVERLVQAWCPRYQRDNSVSLSVQLGSAATLHQEQILADPSYRAPDGDVGAVVYSVIHSLAHMAIKAISVPSGFNVNTFSEYIFPGALSFAVFVNRTQDKGIGGLQTVFNEALPQFMDALRHQDEDCLHDPKCNNEGQASCHACLIVSETTCRAYNNSLDRHLLYGWVGKPGYWP